MARHWYSDQPQNPYSRWHRKYEGLAYIDLDAIEVCKKCTTPLAIIELTKDFGQKFKTFKLTKMIADKLELPGFVVYYRTKGIMDDEIISFNVQKVSPTITNVFKDITPGKWVKYLRKLHTEHAEVCEKETVYDFDKWEGTDPE